MVRRRFFDWHSPALPQFAEALHEWFGSADGGWDSALLVVPSRFVARRLTELLLDLDERGALGGPSGMPRIVTVGQFPEELYEAKRPFADELTQTLAWAEVLRSAEQHELEALLPLRTDEVDWLGLGQLLAVQHRELAADGFRFADVLAAGAEELRDFHDAERWSVMDELQQRYLKRLDALGVWDLQTARLVAVETRECHTDRDVVLLGTVDLNKIVKAMLEQIGDRVTAFVYAPESLADRFDEFGCLYPERWADERIRIGEQQLAYADNPQDQIRHVIRLLSQHAGNHAAQDITIGMLDRELVRELRRELQQVGVPTRWGVGPGFAETPIARLLDTMAEFAETRSYAAFSALVRHPDVYDWLTRSQFEQAETGVGTSGRDEPPEDDEDSDRPPVWRWLSVLDDFAANHFPAEIGSAYLQSIAAVSEPEQTIVGRVVAQVEQWLQPLLDGARRSLDQWAERLRELLGTLYQRLDLRRPDHRVIAGCLAILRKELDAWAALPESLQFALDGPEAVRLLLRRAAHQELPPDPEQHGVELQGWLDLAWDDAAVTIITSFNDRFVPESLNSHLFLPNRLRRAVGLPENTRRYARDAYFLQAILRSRPAVHLITAKIDTRQDPLTPSRLMLTGQAEEIAARLIRFYERASAEAAEPLAADSWPATAPAASVSQFRAQPPVLSQRIQSISVTAFRDYLRCPFRFFLKHVLRLRAVNDTADELDPAAFGSLIHEVLRRFGESELKDSTVAEEIEAFLVEVLHQYVREQFGPRPPVALDLQVRRAMERLKNFARWQASRRASGWRIECVEFKREDCHFAVGGGAAEGDAEQAILLRGRIDRIDIHEDTGVWALLDYKTGDSGRDPEQQHRRAGEWIDLQLPLYRYLVQPIVSARATIELGFVTLDKQESDDLLRPATWDEVELAEADQVARDVVQRILRGEFWPPAEDVPPEYDEFAGICGTGVLWE